MPNKPSLIVLFIAVAGIYFAVSTKTQSNKEVKNNEVLAATMYKSPTCGCCLGHARYLESEDFNVEVVAENDMDSLKTKYDIPYDLQSCHTTTIGNYFVEGHVPIEAINKLLTEKPDIDGITLQEMPSGSPGMPGPKREEFVIYSIKDGVAEEFMRI